MAAAFSLLSAAGGFSGAMAYVGGTLRQIEVNTAAITEIRDHGTGLLQSLTLQVRIIQAEVDAIKKDFRPREFWENNAAQLATLHNRVSELERSRTR